MTFFKRYKLVFILALVFLTPGFLAILVYENPQWMVQKATNRGHWVQPPVKIKLPKSTDKWRMILWQPQTCQNACVQKLDELGRVRLALGRRLYQVETWVFLKKEHALPQATKTMLQEADMDVLEWPTSNYEQYREILTQKPEIFLMDPAGFVVLSYAIDAKPEDLYHDLQHLIRSKEQKK